MKIFKILFLVAVCCLCSGCPDNDEIDSTIKIVNNSSYDVYFWERGYTPELLWKPNENFLILSNSFHNHKGNFRGAHSNESKLYIWLFDREIIDNTPWEEVVENEMYLIRYDLTLQDLEEMNWEVIYEGD